MIGAATGESGPSDDRFRLARPRATAPARRPPLTSGCRCGCERSELPSTGDLRVRSLSRRRGAAGRSLAPAGAGDVEVHGDWRTFSRLYGSPARRLISPSRTPSRPTRSAGRRDAGRLELHRGPRGGVARGTADRDLHGVQRLSAFAEQSSAVPDARPCCSSGLTRKERRGTRRCLASRRRCAFPGGTRDRRQRLAAAVVDELTGEASSTTMLEPESISEQLDDTATVLAVILAGGVAR